VSNGQSNLIFVGILAAVILALMSLLMLWCVAIYKRNAYRKHQVAMRIVNSNLLQFRCYQRYCIVIGQPAPPKEGQMKQADVVANSMEGAQFKDSLKKVGQKVLSGSKLDINNIKVINEGIFKRIGPSDPQVRTILAAPGQQILEYDFREGASPGAEPRFAEDRFHANPE
jgi:hypothetical protein